MTIALVLFSFTGFSQSPILWELNNLESIGGNAVTLKGDPKLVDFGNFSAVEFDGVNDGLFINSNPLTGFNSFTVEIIFKPYAGGLEEQRFLHIQQDNDNRMLIELRSTSTDEWFLDTFIKTKGTGVALYAESHMHLNTQWHHAALIYDNGTMSHFVDGELELSDAIDYSAVNSGITSFGVRQNLVSWYRGAIRLMKASPEALDPKDFLTVDYVSDINSPQNSGLQTEAFSVEGASISSLSQEAHFNIHTNQNGLLTVKLISMHGHQQTLIGGTSVFEGSHSFSSSIGQCSSGIYILEITLNNITKQQKVIVK